jgi:hypothetical protein
LANTPMLRRPGWAEDARAACGRKGEGLVAGWAECLGGPAGRWADWAESEGKILFRIKIGFLNLPRLWKFVAGDLGGVLT